MNRYSQFPFNNCLNKRVLHWDEPNYEPSAEEMIKTMLSGDETSANVKYQNIQVIKRTPIIITANRYIFPNNEMFDCRVFKYGFLYMEELKNWHKQIHPLALYTIFEKYNILKHCNEIKDLEISSN